MTKIQVLNPSFKYLFLILGSLSSLESYDMSSVKNPSSFGDPFLQMSLNMFVFSLDPDQKEQLIEVIEKLLKDKSTVSDTV